MQAIIEQRNRDKSLCGLMETIKDVHSFLSEAGPLKIIKSHRKPFKEMENLTMAGAHLIRDYTLHDNFCTSSRGILSKYALKVFLRATSCDPTLYQC